MTLSYFLYKTAGSFVILPGSLILLFLAASLYFFLTAEKGQKRHISPASFTLLAALLLYILSLPAFAKLILAPLERGYSFDIPAEGKKTAVLVLAGGVEARKGEDGTLGFFMGAETLQRFVAGCFAAERLRCPLIYSGGYPEKAVPGKIEEMVRRTAAAISFRHPLIVEGESRTTGENLERSAPLLRKGGTERVLVVTTAYHLRRALREGGRFLSGLEVIPLPSGQLEDEGRITPLDFVPTAQAFHHTAAAGKEYIGLAASALFSPPAIH